MKTPITYYGGKQRLAGKIVGMIPEHSTYVEPFFGGGAVFFAKRAARFEFINDIDSDLINLYRVMQDPKKAQELLWRIEYTPYSDAEVRRSIDYLKNKNDHSDVETAWAYFVNIAQSFGAMPGRGWIKRRTQSVDNVITYNNKKTLLYLALDRMVNVSIFCENALTLIDRFDDPDCFMFLDPPYPGTHQRYTHAGFTVDNMQDLIDLLDRKKNKFVLTMSDCCVNVPKAWVREEISGHYPMHVQRRKKDISMGRREIILSRM